MAGEATGKVQDAMSEEEIRQAGLTIDVPFESGEARPSRLRYAEFDDGEGDADFDEDAWEERMAAAGVIAKAGTESAPPPGEAEQPGEPSADE